MSQPSRRPFPVKPLVIAILLDIATFLCFYAFYKSATGNTLWLIAGVACAVASFPFYTRIAVGLQRPRR